VLGPVVSKLLTQTNSPGRRPTADNRQHPEES
jgi:hypothetical protein